MLEYNNQYETHPLYNHFKSWIDMEENYQDTYFIINTALYAAEKYIYNTYNIATRATLVHEYFGDITEDKAYAKFNVHNLLGVYTDDGYELPSVIYYDTTSKIYETSTGPLQLNSDSISNVTAINLNMEYVTGYIYPTNALETSVIPLGNDDPGDEVTRPALSNSDGSPLHSPLATSNTYYDLSIIGDPGSTIFINDIEGTLLDAKGTLITDSISTQPTINEDRIGRVTLTLVNGINTFIVDARDDGGNVSETITIVINKQVTFEEQLVELCGKDLVTIDGTYKLIVSSLVGSTITVNGTDVVTYSTGYDVIETTVPTEGIADIIITVTSPAGIVSRELLTHILYDTTISESQAIRINDLGTNAVAMPQDMLMAVLMIANHYFKIALYKNDETFSYGDNVSNRTTFNADRFPKEAHKILSNYLMY